MVEIEAEVADGAEGEMVEIEAEVAAGAEEAKVEMVEIEAEVATGAEEAKENLMAEMVASRGWEESQMEKVGERTLKHLKSLNYDESIICEDLPACDVYAGMVIWTVRVLNSG
ncbi:hypothetical protein AAC387_Pa08g2335 [Persea americana]